MSLVNFLRFSERTGAIISDEEYWNIRFRRRMYGDNLHSLLTAEQADAWDLEAVYGATGYPSLHRETVVAVRAILARKFAEGADDRPRSVEDVARLAFTEMQRAIRRRVDQKLRFHYGFTTEAPHRGYFEEDGTRGETGP